MNIMNTTNPMNNINATNTINTIKTINTIRLIAKLKNTAKRHKQNIMRIEFRHNQFMVTNYNGKQGRKKNTGNSCRHKNRKKKRTRITITTSLKPQALPGINETKN